MTFNRIDRSFQTDTRAQPARPDGRRRQVGASAEGTASGSTLPDEGSQEQPGKIAADERLEPLEWRRACLAEAPHGRTVFE